MKKNIFITFLMFSFSILMVNAELSLTTTAIKNYKDQGYIVSDNVTTYGECSNMVKKYNTEYPSYKRSECFKDGEGYKYFICQTSQSCEIAGGTQSSSSSSTSASTVSTQAGVVTEGTTSSSTTTSVVVPNKDKLDKFISKLQDMKSTMTPVKYQSTLDSVTNKLTKLEAKYASNSTIKGMVSYLLDGVKGLNGLSEVDNFLCDLTDSCGTSQIESSSGCKVNLSELAKDYKTVPLFTTFFQYNGKTYQPDTNGNFLIPSGFKDNIALGNKGTLSLVPPVLTLQCINDELIIYDKNFNKLDKNQSPQNSQNIVTQNNQVQASQPKPTLQINTIDRKTNSIIFTIGTYNKYSTLMLHNDSEGRMVLQCYYLERNSHTSPHCIAAEKISGDYNKSIYKVILTDFAVKNGLEKSSLIAKIDGEKSSEELLILSSKKQVTQDYIQILKTKYPEKYQQYILGTEPGFITCDAENIDGYKLKAGANFHTTGTGSWGIKTTDIINGSKKVGVKECKKTFSCWMGMWNNVGVDLGCENKCNIGYIYQSDIGFGGTCIEDKNIIKVNGTYSWVDQGDGNTQKVSIDVNMKDVDMCNWCGKEVKCNGSTSMDFSVGKDIKVQSATCEFTALKNNKIIFSKTGTSYCSRNNPNEKVFCKFSGLDNSKIENTTCDFSNVCK